MSPGHLLTLVGLVFAAGLGLVVAGYTAAAEPGANAFLLIGMTCLVLAAVLFVFFLRATWKQKLDEFREGLGLVGQHLDRGFWHIGGKPRFNNWRDLAASIRWPPNLTGRSTGLGSWYGQTRRHLNEDERATYRLAQQVASHTEPALGTARRSMTNAMDAWAQWYYWPSFRSFFSKHVLSEYNHVLRMVAYVEIAIAEKSNPPRPPYRTWVRLGNQWPKSL